MLLGVLRCVFSLTSYFPILLIPSILLQLFGASAVTKEYVLGVTDYQKATWTQNFIASIAGAVASITVAAPLDTIKTRIQNANFEKKVSGVTVLKDLVREEGPTAFFKGLTPKVSYNHFLTLPRIQMTDVRGCRLWSLDLNSCSVIHLLKRLFRSLPTMFKTYIPISSSMFFWDRLSPYRCNNDVPHSELMLIRHQLSKEMTTRLYMLRAGPAHLLAICAPTSPWRPIYLYLCSLIITA